MWLVLPPKTLVGAIHFIFYYYGGDHNDNYAASTQIQLSVTQYNKNISLMAGSQSRNDNSFIDSTIHTYLKIGKNCENSFDWGDYNSVKVTLCKTPSNNDVLKMLAYGLGFGPDYNDPHSVLTNKNLNDFSESDQKSIKYFYKNPVQLTFYNSKTRPK